MSRTGRWVVLPAPDGHELVDLLGTATRRRLPVGGRTVAFVGAELWVLDGQLLQRLRPDDLQAPGPDTYLEGTAQAVVAGYGAAARDAVIGGDPRVRVGARDAQLVVEALELAPHEEAIAVHGHRVLVHGRGILRAIERGKPEVWRSKSVVGDVLAASIILGGRAIVVVERTSEADRAIVLRANGALIHRIDLPTVERWLGPYLNYEPDTPASAAAGSPNRPAEGVAQAKEG